MVWKEDVLLFPKQKHSMVRVLEKKRMNLKCLFVVTAFAEYVQTPIVLVVKTVKVLLKPKMTAYKNSFLTEMIKSEVMV